MYIYISTQNICRDPRWGRCQEGYGEDPLLMSELAREYVPNLQNDPNVPQYLQAGSTCKHFDAFSGPYNMKAIDSIVNYRDWLTTYLPAFKACQDVGVSSFMCSYNEINGIPNCANKELLQDILRDEWGFEGYVTRYSCDIFIIPECVETSYIPNINSK